MKIFPTPAPLFELSASTSLAETLAQQLRRAGDRISIKTVNGSLRALLVAALWRQRGGQAMIVCGERSRAENWYTDLSLLLGPDQLGLYVEAKKNIAFELEQLDTRFIGLTAGINLLSRQRKHALLVADAEALGFAVPSPDDVRGNLIKITRGDQLAYDEFIGILTMNGFDRKDFVENIGDIAVRGGIVDIFPPGEENPLRFEFFGDEIDSIREFDPMSQRSIREFESVDLISTMFSDESDKYTARIFDYLDRDTLLIIDEPELVDGRLDELEDADSGAAMRQYATLALNGLGRADRPLSSQTQPQFRASVKTLVHEMRRLTAMDYKIVLAADGKEQLKRLLDLLESGFEAEDEIDDEVESDDVLAPIETTLRKLLALPFALSEGFIYPDARFALFTEHQIFGRQRARKARKRKSVGFTVKELKQLRRGDYVVHVDKGVAQFDGLETISVSGSQQDCVRLIFAGGDKMFVHLNYINRLQKYSAQEGMTPALSKLGSKEWERKKARAKRKLKDIARDLIRLYARRKMQPGMAYPPDTLWQKELEASFIYEDTPDQARSTNEVKRDMETGAPMDRLVCGDVGFGKTEVAIRAAFKAVQAGKQVAVLVPTTILAQQHYETFRDRLARYAVNVDVISRFRARADQKGIVENLGKGLVDVLIGTHRILSNDIEFKSLGLLIIDEEQRFGVGAKEKLRQAKANVDTLTLTATPIPRTLNFSLLGARDISVIATPPRNRIPIHTEILPWNGDIIRAAIEKELERGGQIYMVNDRISDLELLAENLRELVPSLRVSIAHGGMDGSHLEKVMRAFIERRSDVLVATKIIESGIDIPNVNTMLINRADRFGLAELYQLRGRVGRSNIQAHCYLLIPPPHSISRKALRRLQALEEFTELGSGFNLAMRDLEIRGAGNLLGAEQSGYIADIGFEMYQKIVDEAVAEIKEEEFAELFDEQLSLGKKRPHLVINTDVKIDLEGDALLEKSYVAADVERYELYKKLYTVDSEEDLRIIIDEMRDRFGHPPPKAEQLLNVIRLRIAAIPTGFESVSLRNGVLTAEFPPEYRKVFYDRVFQAMLSVLTTDPEWRLTPKGKKVLVQVQAASLERALESLRWLCDKTLKAMADAPVQNEQVAEA